MASPLEKKRRFFFVYRGTAHGFIGCNEGTEIPNKVEPPSVSCKDENESCGANERQRAQTAIDSCFE